MYETIRKSAIIITKGPLYLIGMMIIMLIDISLSTSFCISVCSYSLASAVPIFLVVAAISFVIQYFIIRKLPVRTNAATNLKRNRNRNRHAIILFQLILTALIGVILAQIVYYNYYSTSALSIINYTQLFISIWNVGFSCVPVFLMVPVK